MVDNYRKGVMMAAGTGILWGATGSFAKLISAQGLSQLSVMVYRAAFVAVVLAVWLTCTRGRNALRTPRRQMGLYAVLGFLTIVCSAGGYTMSCTYLSVPRAVVLHYTFPLLAVAGDFLITRERPAKIQIAAALLIVFGLYVSFLQGGTAEPVNPVGIAWGVLSVCGFAGQALLTRMSLRDGKTDPIVQLFYVHVFGGLIILIGKSLLMGWADLSGLTPQTFALMQYPAIAASLFAFALLFNALKYIPATTASLVCTLEIVFALVAMPFLLHQWPTTREFAGAGIVLFAVACSTLGGRRVVK